MTEAQRIFSGIQPTGYIHLGNYLGAVRRWVDQQSEFDSFFCIVDLHAMTLPWDPKELQERSVATGAMLLACGIDPTQATLYLQSHVPAHSELAWVLSCIARMGELRRMVQFKEKSKGETESVGVGLFTYPVLQAADVLLYRAHGVPVGEDQRQHVELMRDIATRFNSQLGEVFVLPEAWIPAAGARIMSLDDPSSKMSKSANRPNSAILLEDKPEVIAKKIRSAVTDSGREVTASPDKPAVTNLLTIYSVLAGESIAAVQERFVGKGYGDLKVALADVVVAALSPLRERYEELMADPAETARLLAIGAARASEVAATTMADVRRAAGLVPPA